MSVKCASEDCQHKTTTNNALCSVCRQRNKEKHKCAIEDCERLCLTQFCRHHAHKLQQCAYIKPGGQRCTNNGRNEYCLKKYSISAIVSIDCIVAPGAKE